MKLNRRWHHVYVLIDPFTREIRYVGTTVSPKDRMNSHIHDGFACHRKYQWVQSLRRKGTLPEMRIVKRFRRRKRALNFENNLILGLCLSCQLFNHHGLILDVSSPDYDGIVSRAARRTGLDEEAYRRVALFLFSSAVLKRGQSFAVPPALRERTIARAKQLNCTRQVRRLLEITA